jgi:hypothetical protein
MMFVFRSSLNHAPIKKGNRTTPAYIHCLTPALTTIFFLVPIEHVCCIKVALYRMTTRLLKGECIQIFSEHVASSCQVGPTQIGPSLVYDRLMNGFLMNKKRRVIGLWEWGGGDNTFVTLHSLIYTKRVVAHTIIQALALMYL